MRLKLPLLGCVKPWQRNMRRYNQQAAVVGVLLLRLHTARGHDGIKANGGLIKQPQGLWSQTSHGQGGAALLPARELFNGIRQQWLQRVVMYCLRQYIGTQRGGKGRGLSLIHI
jgi:hypothetical protein